MNNGVLTSGYAPLSLPGGLLGRSFNLPMPDGLAFDPQAAAYVQAVEAADGRPLERNVAAAINAFVVGCKDDGNWSALKACCILSGARTLSGALTPLTGAAPTSFNFVSADYLRATGLKGDAVSKYLNANRLASEDAHGDYHMAAYVSEVSELTAQPVINANAGAGTSGNNLQLSQISVNVRNQSTGANQPASLIARASNAFYGHTRSNTSNISGRRAGVSVPIVQASAAPVANQTNIFRNTATLAYSNHRVAFYSFGSNVVLETLERRVLALMSAFSGLQG